MASRESVEFDFLSHGAGQLAGDFKRTGDSAVLAAKGARLLADSLDRQRRAADASAGATLASAKADKILADASDEAIASVVAQRIEQDKLAGSAKKTAAETAAAGKAATAAAGTGGIPGGGLGAVAAAAALAAPVVITAGLGLGAFGLAALGAGKNSRQFKAELAPLKADVAAFQAQLRPTVLADFGKAAAAARTGLHGLEPAAAGAGKALGDVLGSVGAELRSQEFVQFFQFLGREAGPDTRLLGQVFTDLLRVAPPLIEDLHGVSVEAFRDLDGIVKLIGGIEHLAAEQHKLQVEAANSSGWLGRLAHAAGQAFGELVPGGVGIKHVADELGRLAGNTSQAGMVTADLIHPLGTFRAGMLTAAGAAATEKIAVTALTTALKGLGSGLLTTQADEVSWRQAQEAASQAIRQNKAALDSNKASALNARAAIISSTQSALAFANQEVSVKHNTDAASAILRDQIRWLEQHAGKSRIASQEVGALRAALQKMQGVGPIHENIFMTGRGTWGIFGRNPVNSGLFNAASGGMVSGGIRGKDSVLVNAMPGEVIVPTRMVQAGAVDHLRGRLPGFASGGVVGSYRGGIGDPYRSWLTHDWNASLLTISNSMAAAIGHAVRAAVSAAFAGGSGGPASGAVRALQAYAASLFHFYGWGSNQLPPLVALWNGESGWNPRARNPSSGAFGIPQALPPSKMGALAASGNAAAQIRWGEGYIHSVYGDPANAYGTWLSRSPHWYGSGLQGGIFTRPTLIGVGERGPERVSVTPMVMPGRGSSAGDQRIVLEVRSGAEGRIVAAFLEMIRHEVRIRGGGDVQRALGRL
jgi:hypothetical protein